MRSCLSIRLALWMLTTSAAAFGDPPTETRYLNCRAMFRAVWNAGASTVGLTPLAGGAQSHDFARSQPFELSLPGLDLRFVANGNGRGLIQRITHRGRTYDFSGDALPGGIFSFPFHARISIDEADRLFGYRPTEESSDVEIAGLEFSCWVSTRNEFGKPSCESALGAPGPRAVLP